MPGSTVDATELATMWMGSSRNELPRGGFAPSWWTNEISASAVPAEPVSIVDGDTLVVTLNSVEDEVRFYRSDAPENQGCGGEAATEILQRVFRYNDDDLTIYLESDATDRDRYFRKLAYAWIEVNGLPYMLNEGMERSGWARDVDFGDRLYGDQLAMASQVAELHQIGQYSLCGGFDAEDVTQEDAPLAEQEQEGPGAVECDPAYPDVCIPPI